MATNNTENTNIKAETNANDKSLFSKAKDTLVDLGQQAASLFSENNADDSEIKGMSKEQFEKTKEKLEPALHLKQKEMTNDVQFQSENGANVNMKYEQVNQQEFVKAPAVLNQKTEFVDDKRDELKYSKIDKNEVHVLPTIHVQEKPVIIEKEIEFEKPIEIKETIIHREKPIIVEKPIIKEKHEHYREATQLEKNHQKIVTENISSQDTGTQDQEAILNLRQERINSHSDTTPIIQHEKQNVQLDTEFRAQPTQIREKEVVYEQPVEIQRTEIEKIKPKIREEVTLEKEHIRETVAPEVHQANAKVVESEKYFSQDTARNNNNDVSTSANMVHEENKQKKEVM